MSDDLDSKVDQLLTTLGRKVLTALARSGSAKGMKSVREEARMGRYGRVWEKFIVTFALPIAIVAVAFALFDRPARAENGR
jgi:hypothetical protein